MRIDAHEVEEATGVEDPWLGRTLIDQAIQALSAINLQTGRDRDEAVSAAMAALKGIGPRDTMESLLATQMVSTHHAAMECLRRSQIGEQTFAGRDLNLKHATKLLALYARQMEALDKHRGHGQQKITVEHVNVHAGGQAIVGNVDRPANAPQPAPEAPRLAAPNEMDAPMQILDGAAVVRAKQKARRSRED